MTNIIGGAPPVRTSAEREKRLGVLEKALGVATALLVLVSTGLGIVAKRSADQKDDLNASVSRLDQRVEQLEHENGDLRAQLGAQPPVISSTPSASTPAASTPAASTDSFRATTAPVTLRKGQSIDFDTTAADWGVSTSGFDTDLKLSAVPLGLSAAVGLSLIEGTPTYARCTSDTIQYQLLSTPEQIKQGAAFCVKTGKQRVAGVVIQSVQTGLVSISITQTVWG